MTKHPETPGLDSQPEHLGKANSAVNAEDKKWNMWTLWHNICPIRRLLIMFFLESEVKQVTNLRTVSQYWKLQTNFSLTLRKQREGECPRVKAVFKNKQSESRHVSGERGEVWKALRDGWTQLCPYFPSQHGASVKAGGRKRRERIEMCTMMERDHYKGLHFHTPQL